jgi:hypothetical protein
MILDVVEKWVMTKVNSDGFVLVAEAHGSVQFAVFASIFEHAA